MGRYWRPPELRMGSAPTLIKRLVSPNKSAQQICAHLQTERNILMEENKTDQHFKEYPLGFLGNLFIDERMRISSFDEAFDDWKAFEHTMEFLLRYPMVADYNRYDEHRKERRKELRQLAKEWFGDHIKSADVEVLVWIIQSFRCFGVMPEKRREFDTSEVVAAVDQILDMETLSDAEADVMTSDFTSFVAEHDLSHVPLETMALLYIRQDAIH